MVLVVVVVVMVVAVVVMMPKRGLNEQGEIETETARGTPPERGYS